MQEYDIEIKYRTGNANANADALSRMPQEIDYGISTGEDLDDSIFAVIHNLIQEIQLMEGKLEDHES